MEKLLVAAVAFSQVAWTLCSLSLECAPQQEIICPTNETFAWCVYTQHQDRCPPDLYCDPSLSYICSEDPPLPPLTTPLPEIPSDEFLPSDLEDNEPWDCQATPPSTCTRPGRFPDADDCTIFHICLDPELTHIQVSCPQGSHFSARFGKCVEPERAKCDPRYQNFQCPDIGPMPDPEDCSAFRICHPDDTWRRYQCPSGSNFNSRLSRCSTNATSDTCELGDPEKKNMFVCSAKGLFEDRESCRKFYYCIPLEDGTFAQGQAMCPRNSVFNVKTARCTIDLDVCKDAEKFCKSRHPGKYPGKEGCSTFFWCGLNGASHEYICPYGSNFDPMRGICIYESKSHCEIHHFQCKMEGKFPDVHNDCDGFFVCADFHQKWKVQRYRCPKGTKFDFAKKKCLPEADVFCHMPVILL